MKIYLISVYQTVFLAKLIKYDANGQESGTVDLGNNFKMNQIFIYADVNDMNNQWELEGQFQKQGFNENG